MINPFTREQIIEAGRNYGEPEIAFERGIGPGSVVCVREQGVPADIIKTHKENGRFYGYVGIVLGGPIGFSSADYCAVMWEGGCHNSLHWAIDYLELYEPQGGQE